MSGRRRRSVSLAIFASSVSVLLGVALLVAWIAVLVSYRDATRTAFGEHLWLLIGGVLSLVTIITVLVLFGVFLTRQIFEVRRQDSFIDSVTHELRSPLAALRLCLQTLDRPDLGDDRAKELRTMMLEDVARLDTLIETILSASRASLGRKARRVDTIALGSLIEDCALRISRRRGTDPSCIEVDVPSALTIRTDAGLLRTILDNLLDNALKYGGSTPKVHVSVDLRAKTFDLLVRDEGIGIGAHDLKRVFHRFFRGAEEAVRERHGTGLGLFIVWAIARNLGASVSATSQGEGKGSCFRVRWSRRKIGATLDAPAPVDSEVAARQLAAPT